MSIFSNMFKVPKSVNNVVKQINNLPPRKSLANIVSVKAYSPTRSLEQTLERASLSLNANITEIKPEFDVDTITSFYDSVLPDRLVICYSQDRKIFITTHENLFRMYSYLGVNEEEGGYEVIYPGNLYTLSIVDGYKVGIPYEDISGLTSNMGFMGGFLRVDRLIRHKVKKPIIHFRSSLGESKTTKDHSYILMNGQTATPEELNDLVPGRVRYMNDDDSLYFYIDYNRNGSHDIMFLDEKVIVVGPSFSEFVKFVIDTVTYGYYDDKSEAYMLPISPFLVGLCDNDVAESDNIIKISKENERVFNIINNLFHRFEVIGFWAFDRKFLQVLAANLFDVSCRCYKTKSSYLAALLSFYFMISEIDYRISYDDDSYCFIDTRLSGLPITYTNIEFKEDNDYEGYVYDMSVDGSQCFVDPIGMLTLHNTDSILRDVVNYYVSRMPVEDMKVVSSKPALTSYVLYRMKRMYDLFGCNLFGSFFNEIVKELVLYGNVFLHRVYSKRKYKGKNIVIYYEILPLDSVSILFDAKKNKIVGYYIDGYGKVKESEIIHIFYNKYPGFFFGRPNTLAVLNDIKVLRLLEQNLEIMGVAYSSPQLVYKVGKPTAPASNPPNGLVTRGDYNVITDQDLQNQSQQIQSMSPHDIKIIPWYHSIEGVNVSPPIDLVEPISIFRRRIYQAFGLDPIVMGDVDSRNRDASVVGERTSDRNVSVYLRLIIDVLNRDIINKDFIDDVGLNGDAYIHIPRIDMSDFFQRVNLGVTLWQSNLITQDEMRRDYLGLDPMGEADMEKTFTRMTQKISGGPDEAAAQAGSSVNPTNQHGKQGTPAPVKKR